MRLEAGVQHIEMMANGYTEVTAEAFRSFRVTDERDEGADAVAARKQVLIHDVREGGVVQVGQGPFMGGLSKRDNFVKGEEVEADFLTIQEFNDDVKCARHVLFREFDGVVSNIHGGFILGHPRRVVVREFFSRGGFIRLRNRRDDEGYSRVSVGHVVREFRGGLERFDEEASKRAANPGQAGVMHGDSVRFVELLARESEPHEMVCDASFGKAFAKTHEVFALRGERMAREDPVTDWGGGREWWEDDLGG